jgi:hypothetical protein
MGDQDKQGKTMVHQSVQQIAQDEIALFEGARTCRDDS